MAEFDIPVSCIAEPPPLISADGMQIDRGRLRPGRDWLWSRAGRFWWRRDLSWSDFNEAEARTPSKMPENVTKLEPVEIGENYRFDADTVLDEAKGKGFTRLAILGELPDGEIYVTGTANAGQTLVLMELAKLKIIGK